MTLFRRLLIITFLESASTLLIERGIFFYTKEFLNFSDGQNLMLALAFATPYALGSLASHRITASISEKKLIAIAIIGQSFFLGVVAYHPVMWTIFLAKASMGAFTGIKWPPIESYVNAGLTPKKMATQLGKFNITWAFAVPLAVLAVGPLIAIWDRLLFIAPIAIALFSLLALRPLQDRPTHLPDDHPERPEGKQLHRIQCLMRSSRWLLLLSYGLYFVIAALMPGIFKRFGYEITISTALSSGMEIARFGIFLVLVRFTAWHNKAWPIAVACLLLPIGLILMLTEINVITVIAGELIFGLAMGMSYYAALYYAMVAKNATVAAGGEHEGLIGLAFIVGPLAGLLGNYLGAQWGHPSWGMLAGVCPLLLFCLMMSLRNLKGINASL